MAPRNSSCRHSGSGSMYMYAVTAMLISESLSKGGLEIFNTWYYILYINIIRIICNTAASDGGIILNIQSSHALQSPCRSRARRTSCAAACVDDGGPVSSIDTDRDVRRIDPPRVPRGVCRHARHVEPHATAHAVVLEQRHLRLRGHHVRTWSAAHGAVADAER